MLERLISSLLELKVTWEIVIATLCLAMYCLNRFNTWTEKEQVLAKESPPRHYTTKSRYTTYATLYVLAIVSIFLVFLSLPGFLLAINQTFSLNILTPEKIQGRDFPFILLLLLIVVFPSIKPLRLVEENIRSWFHRQAFIPSQATALINHLVNKTSYFSTEPPGGESVLEELSEYLPDNVNPLIPSNDLWHLWFKLLYLRQRISDWQEEPKINQFTVAFGNAYKDNMTSFQDLQREIKYFARRSKDHQVQSRESMTLEDDNYISHEAENIRMLRDKLIQDINRKLKTTYQYICCGILSTESSENCRKERFDFFNLTPDVEENLPFVVDSLIIAMVFVFVVTTLTSLLYKYLSTFKLQFLSALDIGMVHTIMQGFCIFLAYYIYRKYERAGWYNTQKNQGSIIAGPKLQWVVGVIIGYVPSFLILIIWMSMHNDGRSLLEVIQRNWFWPLPVAATTAFITYYLASIKKNRKGQWREGIVQATVQGIIAFVVAWTAAYELEIVTRPDQKIALIGYITLTLALTGWCIGRVFPSEYRKALRMNHIDRRQGERITITTPTTVLADQSYSIEKSEVSISGASIPIELEQGINSPLQYQIPGLGSLLGRVSRKAEGQTYLAFILTQDERGKLSNFLAMQLRNETVPIPTTA